jgi:hypothetical protein
MYGLRASRTSIAGPVKTMKHGLMTRYSANLVPGRPGECDHRVTFIREIQRSMWKAAQTENGS